MSVIREKGLFLKNECFDPVCDRSWGSPGEKKEGAGAYTGLEPESPLGPREGDAPSTCDVYLSLGAASLRKKEKKRKR